MDLLLELLELAQGNAGELAGWSVAAALAIRLRKALVLLQYHERRDVALLKHVKRLRTEKKGFADALQRSLLANAQQAETIRAWRVVARNEGWADNDMKTVRFEPFEAWSPVAPPSSDPPPLPLNDNDDDDNAA